MDMSTAEHSDDANTLTTVQQRDTPRDYIDPETGMIRMVALPPPISAAVEDMMMVRGDLIPVWWKYYVSTRTTSKDGQQQQSEKHRLEQSGYVIFTSNGGGQDGRNLQDGKPTENGTGNGTFAAHPTSLRDRPLRAFYNMLRRTQWTMAIMIGTVARQHPLIDIDFHGHQNADAMWQTFTDARIQQAVRVAGNRMFVTTGQEDDAKVLRPLKGDGIHVVALGYVITQNHKRMNAEFVRQVHRAFDELIGHTTPEKGLWDVHITSLRIPGTTKQHAISPDTAYAAVNLPVADMMRWSGIAPEPTTQTADEIRPEFIERQGQQRARKLTQREGTVHPLVVAILQQAAAAKNARLTGGYWILDSGYWILK